jgi:biotin carboxyl carrier protein
MRVPQSGGSILAPMPGRVLVVHVRERDVVEMNAPLMVLEAMKMEHVIRAPAKGSIARLSVKEGQQVKEGDPLIEIGKGDASS